MPTSRHLVVVLAHPPVAALELGCVAEVLGGPAPEAGRPWYSVAVASMNPGPVPSTSGIDIHAAHGLDLIALADTVVIPSWDPERSAPPEIAAAIRKAHRCGTRLVSLSSGAFLLAAAGVLDGRRAVTHWLHGTELAARYPRVRVEADALYADEGQIITGAGSAATLDLLLHVVATDHGSRLCNLAARQLAAAPHREGSEAQRLERPVPPPGDRSLSDVIEHLRLHAAEPVRADDLAAMAKMSLRSFNRKFRQTVGRSPYDWVISRRVEIAKQLLEQGELSIEEVGAEAGFGSTNAFRRAFCSIAGMKPASYRRAFAPVRSRRAAAPRYAQAS